MLEGRRIVLGVSGGIAAYKAIEVCRRLVDAGAHVVPIMTRGATRFVGETTFSALASEPVHTSLFDDADPIPHTRLGQSADVVVVAPATARVIGSYAAGISNDLLTATLLATEAPVVVAPAMHTEMWDHPAVQENVATLVRRGVHVVAPEEGRLAGGDVGRGRLAAPEAIVAGVEAALGATRDLEGLHVVITAGGTREPHRPGAVHRQPLVGQAGPRARRRGRRPRREGHAGHHRGAARRPPTADVVRVDTAAEMDEAVRAVASAADVIVMAAAVADFRPAQVAAHKIKKHDGVPDIALEPTVDILAGLGERKRPGQTVVGFAAETDRVRQNATSKLVAKGADVIVANDVTAAGAGFEHDTNSVVIMHADGTEREVPLADKRVIARSVFDAVINRRQQP